MVVINEALSYGHKAYIDKMTDKKRIEVREQKKTAVKKDAVVNISDASKDIQTAKDAVENAADVRAEKVAELKKAVSDGTYQIDADKIAQRMMESITPFND